MIYLLLLLSVALFGVFFGHVIGFGWRTRKTDLHATPRSTRDERDRRSVGCWESHEPRRLESVPVGEHPAEAQL
jgi:hypothetical protein